MSYAIYPLTFDTPVHFGRAGQGGRLEQAGMEYPADVLFSALCAELAAAGEEAALEKLVEGVRRRRLLFSDLLPWQRGEDEAMEFFVPRPVLRILPADVQAKDSYSETCRLAGERKKQKKLKYIRASRMAAYIEAMKGGALFADAADFGEMSLRQRVNCREKEPLPYYVGQFDFHADAGLYILAYAEAEADADWLQALLVWLGCAGIGGKRSSGYGKFHLAEDAIFLDDVGVYADDAALYAMLRAKEASWQMALSPVLPKETELGLVQEGEYRLRRSGGFITAPRHEAQKKASICLLDAGSCFSERIEGMLADLGECDGHAVWRYGLGLYAGVEA